MQFPHVVLIEDDDDLLGAEALLLTSQGFRVTAFSAVESLDMLPKLKADVFLIDEQLPNISGHIICMYLRSKPETADVPVILLSGHASLGEYASLSGADAAIEKPFGNAGLLTVIRDILSGERENLSLV